MTVESLINFSQNEWIEWLTKERWGDRIICPVCESEKYYKCVRKSDPYKCARCYHKFGIFTGTCFAQNKNCIQNYFLIICDLCGWSNNSGNGYGRVGIMTQKTAWVIRKKLSQYINSGITCPIEQMKYLIKLKIGIYSFPYIIQDTQRTINKIQKLTNATEHSRFAQQTFHSNG